MSDPNSATNVPPAPSTALSSEFSNSETSEPPALVEADLLVEDISIDGMCGVY